MVRAALLSPPRLLQRTLFSPCPSCKLQTRHSNRTAAEADSGPDQQLSAILDRPWLLHALDTQLTTVRLRAVSRAVGAPSFSVIRDDLLHPIAGSKLRKFDARFPELLAAGVTDIVTCGGLQSAHTAAVAALAVEHGMQAHLLVRGERPAVPTGFHLLARLLGRVTYVTRSEYAGRGAMFETHAARIQDSLPPDAKLATIPEGASDAASLWGLLRLVRHLAAETPLGGGGECSIVVDSGTGTTAIGMALGVALLRLPWRIVGVMLAGSREYYEQQAVALTAATRQQLGAADMPEIVEAALPLEWVDRTRPRRFGNVLPGEVEACRDVARAHGILLDPIYSLAAWETAAKLAAERVGDSGHRVAMLHAGGGLALHGLAQRFPDQF